MRRQIRDANRLAAAAFGWRSNLGDFSVAEPKKAKPKAAASASEKKSGSNPT